MKLTIKSDKLYVESPYSDKFIRKARQINGKWSKPHWVFPAENEQLVRDLCREVYGTDGTPEATVTMLLTLQEIHCEDSLTVGPVQVLKKWARDDTPTLGTGCTVVQGTLKQSGGSRNNPRITHSEDCVVRVKDIPQSIAVSLAESNPAAYQIDNSDTTEVTLTADEVKVAAFLRNLAPERLQAILKSIS